jgi:hypothetical protein
MLTAIGIRRMRRIRNDDAGWDQSRGMTARVSVALAALLYCVIVIVNWHD